MNGMQNYWDALERLKKNKPIKVAPGARINNDTVALEAGRKRGSIKKSRSVFNRLINAIDEAASQTVQSQTGLKEKLAKEKLQKANYQELYIQSLNRELMLLDRLAELEKLLKQYGKIIPISAKE